MSETLKNEIIRRAINEAPLNVLLAFYINSQRLGEDVAKDILITEMFELSKDDTAC